MSSKSYVKLDEIDNENDVTDDVPKSTETMPKNINAPEAKKENVSRPRSETPQPIPSLSMTVQREQAAQYSQSRQEQLLSSDQSLNGEGQGQTREVKKEDRGVTVGGVSIDDNDDQSVEQPNDIDYKTVMSRSKSHKNLDTKYFVIRQAKLQGFLDFEKYENLEDKEDIFRPKYFPKSHKKGCGVVVTFENVSVVPLFSKKPALFATRSEIKDVFLSPDSRFVAFIIQSSDASASAITDSHNILTQDHGHSRPFPYCTVFKVQFPGQGEYVLEYLGFK